MPRASRRTHLEAVHLTLGCLQEKEGEAARCFSPITSEKLAASLNPLAGKLGVVRDTFRGS